jgi:hypothetical protein
MRSLISLLLWLLVAVVPQGSRGAPPTPSTPEEVAPGDWVHFGQIALTTPENRGDIAHLALSPQTIRLQWSIPEAASKLAKTYFPP